MTTLECEKCKGLGFYIEGGKPINCTCIADARKEVADRHCDGCKFIICCDSNNRVFMCHLDRSILGKATHKDFKFVRTEMCLRNKTKSFLHRYRLGEQKEYREEEEGKYNCNMCKDTGTCSVKNIQGNVKFYLCSCEKGNSKNAHKGGNTDSVKGNEEMVNHPKHYGNGPYEVIKVIHAWDLGFDLGNAVKYIAIAGKKYSDKTLEDLEKAKWYIQSEIDKLKSRY